MKATRKYFSLTIEYTDREEVTEAMKKIARKILAGKVKYDRDKENTAIYEWAIDSAEPVPYEEKIINGQWCRVYQSKLNTSND